MFTLYAYDKDNDNYEMLRKGAFQHLVDWSKTVDFNNRCSINGEPFDWIEIHDEDDYLVYVKEIKY